MARIGESVQPAALPASASISSDCLPNQPHLYARAYARCSAIMLSTFVHTNSKAAYAWSFVCSLRRRR